jgi:hypothetical protein
MFYIPNILPKTSLVAVTESRFHSFWSVTLSLSLLSPWQRQKYNLYGNCVKWFTEFSNNWMTQLTQSSAGYLCCHVIATWFHTNSFVIHRDLWAWLLGLLLSFLVMQYDKGKQIQIQYNKLQGDQIARRLQRSTWIGYTHFTTCHCAEVCFFP